MYIIYNVLTFLELITEVRFLGNQLKGTTKGKCPSEDKYLGRYIRSQGNSVLNNKQRERGISSHNAEGEEMQTHLLPVTGNYVDLRQLRRLRLTPPNITHSLFQNNIQKYPGKKYTTTYSVEVILKRCAMLKTLDTLGTRGMAQRLLYWLLL